MKILRNIRNFFNAKVLLCDLNDTLIVTKSGATFPENEDDWKFKPGINYAIRQYNPKYIFIISNQGGIEKGFVDEKKFYANFRRIIEEMRTWGDFIVEGTYCKSNDPECVDRKPNTGMVDFFRHAYVMGWDFDNRHALMIGDASGLDGQFSDSDLQCAKNAGIRYCDVDKFIEAADPCVTCKADCGEYPMYDELPPFFPCKTSYKERLKRVIIK